MNQLYQQETSGKFLLFKLYSCHKNSGFTLIEVLVTILVVTGFVLGSLQAVVLATFFRVQAQDKNEALNWVQQDLELIRYQAFMFDRQADGTYEEDEGTCGSYGEDFRISIADNSPALHPTTESIDIGLETNQRTYNVQREYTPSGNTLQITHTVNYGDTHPRRNPNNNQVTTLSTEVIPDAALSCN